MAIDNREFDEWVVRQLTEQGGRQHSLFAPGSTRGIETIRTVQKSPVKTHTTGKVKRIKWSLGLFVRVVL